MSRYGGSAAVRTLPTMEAAWQSRFDLINQVSPGMAPNIMGAVVPALSILGIGAIAWNAMRMIVSGEQRGVLTGRPDRTV